MLQLNTWTHPKTGQIRVYVNGAPFQSGAKLFVERIDANEFGDDWHVVVVADWGMDRHQARDSAADATGHGAALPHLQHGGPGRAGGGAELGGFIGMMPYLQRTALQAAPVTLDLLAGI